MPQQVRVSGTWRHVRARTRVSGKWREVPQAYINNKGTWKPLYSFSWEMGEWGSCSASCGGGVQTRTSNCKRTDWQYYDDAVCSRFVGEKPVSTQACNTQSCSECRYDYNMVDGSGGNFWYLLFAGGGSITIGYSCGDMIYPSASACSQMCAEGHCVPFTIDGGSWSASTTIVWDGVTVSGDTGLYGEPTSYISGGYLYTRGNEVSRDSFGAYYQVCRQAV